MSRYSRYFICKVTISPVQHFHKCSTFLQVYYLQIIKPLILASLQVNNQSIRQVSDLLSISEQYMAQDSSSLWYSINFRSLYIPESNKPLIFYQFQSNMTCSSPRRQFFLHTFSFECTSKLCINFLNQFPVYFHILRIHYTI